MIIHPDANRKNYSELILKGFHGGQASKGQFRCPNPDCRCDVFYNHGTYNRHFLHFEQELEPEPDDTVAFTLPEGLACVDSYMEILRVKCVGCGMTHGIAFEGMIPFQVFSLSAFLMTILYFFRRDTPLSAKTPVIRVVDGMSWHTLKHMLLIYLDHRSLMMAALRQQGLYTAARDLEDVPLAHTYLGLSPPDGAWKAYLFCHKQPVFINRRNTVSYPLRFIIPLSR